VLTHLVRMTSEHTKKPIGVVRAKLQEVLLFKHAPNDALSELEKCLQSRFFKKGSFIVKHNDIAKEMFFIISGDVDIIDANNRIFAQGHSGEFFGELGLIYSIPRTASVRAVTDVELCMLSKKDFDALRSKVPAIEDEVIRLAMERLSRFQVELVKLASIPEGTSFTQEQLQVFQEVFFYWDRNNDNILDKTDVRELIQALSGKKFTEHDLERILRMLDSDQDGVVSFEDFVKKIRSLGWFLAPKENQRIKRVLGQGSRGEEETSWDVRSLVVGVMVGVLATLVPVGLVWWSKHGSK